MRTAAERECVNGGPSGQMRITDKRVGGGRTSKVTLPPTMVPGRKVTLVPVSLMRIADPFVSSAISCR